MPYKIFKSNEPLQKEDIATTYACQSEKSVYLNIRIFRIFKYAKFMICEKFMNHEFRLRKTVPELWFVYTIISRIRMFACILQRLDWTAWDVRAYLPGVLYLQVRCLRVSKFITALCFLMNILSLLVKARAANIIFSLCSLKLDFRFLKCVFLCETQYFTWTWFYQLRLNLFLE